MNPTVTPRAHTAEKALLASVTAVMMFARSRSTTELLTLVQIIIQVPFWGIKEAALMYEAVIHNVLYGTGSLKAVQFMAV